MKNFLLVAFFSLLMPLGFSQHCGFDIANEGLKNRFPQHQMIQKNYFEEWRKTTTNKAVVTDIENRISYEIPVVIHVMHNGEAIGHPNNPTDQEIYAYMDYVNQVFAAKWHYFRDTNNGGINIPFKFVLAKRTPGCNPQPTNGITRTNLGALEPDYLTDGVTIDNQNPAGIDDFTLKSHMHWPSDEYYNIYLVHAINSAGGYAYYPLTHTIYDGTVLLSQYTKPTMSNGDYYYAFPHEIGHGWGLPHTFEGDVNGTCPDNNDCNYDGDGICDTEPHLLTGNGGCASGINSCTGNPYAGVQYNIMNYTACPELFTPMQKDKMFFSLLTYRAGLLNSLGNTPPDPHPVVTSTVCIPSNIYQDPSKSTGSYNIIVNQQTISTLSYVDDYYQEYRDVSCNQKPFHLNLTGNNTINITTLNSPQQVKVYIDFNNNGIFENTELVLHNDGSSDIAGSFNDHIANFSLPSGVSTCTLLRMRVITDESSSPEVFPCNNVEYGQIEDFAVKISDNPVLPIFNISSNEDMHCTAGTLSFQANFQHGTPTMFQWYKNGVLDLSGSTATQYSTSNSTTNNEIICYATFIDECGNSTVIQSNSVHFTNKSLHANIQSFPDFFIAQPTGSSYVWLDCETNSVVTSTNVAKFTPTQSGKYKVVATKAGCSDTSVCVVFNKVSIEENELQFDVFPNPSDGNFNIVTQGTITNPITLRITDITGKILSERLMLSNSEFMHLDVSSGVYFLILSNGENTTTRKIIIH